jgi:hypothetical protein
VITLGRDGYVLKISTTRRRMRGGRVNEYVKLKVVPNANNFDKFDWHTTLMSELRSLYTSAQITSGCGDTVNARIA